MPLLKIYVNFIQNCFRLGTVGLKLAEWVFKSCTTISIGECELLISNHIIGHFCQRMNRTAMVLIIVEKCYTRSSVILNEEKIIKSVWRENIITKEKSDLSPNKVFSLIVNIRFSITYLFGLDVRHANGFRKNIGFFNIFCFRKNRNQTYS